MRILSVALAGVLVTGCTTTSYKIPGSEVQRLAMVPPEARGQHVRVIQQLGETDTGPRQAVDGETQIVFMPDIYIDVGGGRRTRQHGHYDGSSGWGGGHSSGGAAPTTSGGSSGGSKGFNGGGGDGKAEAIAVLVAAAVILVAAAAVEGSRFDGYANLHPMHPVHLEGKDGSKVTIPLAWLDPATASFTDHAIIKSNEGPFQALERAPLSREGFTYAMFAGLGTYESADGSKDDGTATTVQLGFFPDQKWGIVGSMFFGWRQNAVDATLFESRYTVELQAYPLQQGIFHGGLYGGAGGAYRFEDGIPGGNAGSTALLGGAMLQLDINTRLALTARFGKTFAHSEHMTDAMVGLAVY